MAVVMFFIMQQSFNKLLIFKSCVTTYHCRILC